MRITFAFLLAFISSAAFAQTIAEIQGETDSSPYNNLDVSVTGIVTGVGPESYFIQDAPGAWNGIYVYDQTQSPSIGDEVSFSAVVDEYFTLTELVDITNFETLSTGNDLFDPVLVSSSDISNEMYEGVLIRVENATCTNSDAGFGEFEIDDGSGVGRVDDLMYLFSANEGTSYSITGIGYYSFDFYKLVPRMESDVENAAPLYFTELPEEFDITTSSMTINWETNTEANSILEYGVTTDYELGTITIDGNTTSHEVMLTDLTAATVYYLRIHSEVGEDSTVLYERVVCAASESSGEIAVYFTQPVETSVMTISEATYTDNITQVFVDLINQAQSTLDITMYDTEGGSPAIVEAINARFDAGVDVRYITDSELENVELDALDPGISVLAGNENGIMHDKFIVIDVASVDDALVVTGSTNHTSGNLGWDFNNVVTIQDQSLAIAYTMEFEEMWGGSEMTPDEGNSKFSSDKSDNTPHKFNIAGTEVECYFSPTDHTTSHMADAVTAAQNDMIFAIMAFTENSLGTAVAEAHAGGVNVQGIIDYIEFNGSEFDYLLGQGVDVMDYVNADGSQWPDGPVLHHKYAVLDYAPGSDNPCTITGSHNWTASAESINDENTLLIYDHEVSNWFFQEWTKRWDDLIALGMDQIDFAEKLSVYPNPTDGILNLFLPSEGTIQIFAPNGQKILGKNLNRGIHQLDCGFLNPGLYFLNWNDGKAVETNRFIIR